MLRHVSAKIDTGYTQVISIIKIDKIVERLMVVCDLFVGPF